jgi:hypothetical protein
VDVVTGGDPIPGEPIGAAVESAELATIGAPAKVGNSSYHYYFSRLYRTG